MNELLFPTIDTFLVLSIQLFFKIFSFLGTINGELLKNLIEFIIYTVVSYMLISEFRRIHRRELAYLILGFFSLMIGRFIITIAYSYIVFMNISAPNVDVFLPIIDNVLEIIALIFVTNAFLFPLFKKSKRTAKRFENAMYLKVVGFLIIATIAQFYWVNVHKFIIFDQSLAYLMFEVLKLTIFSYPIIAINNPKNRKIIGRYANSIIVAFMLFLAAPIFNILNYLFYNSSSTILIIFALPFPLLSMLFFIRVVYFKLVDKATLREKLSRTQQKYEQQKEISELKDEFVSTVSHELRTPLTNIKLYLSLLRDGEFGKLKAKQKSPIKLIGNESDRLNNLINDILSLAKLEAKKQELHIKEVKLHELINKTIYHEMAKKKKIRVINNIPRSMKVNIDENLFKQVIINLFSNALKFTNKGSITFNAEQDEQGIELAVTDTGIGINKSKLPYLFDKFYQAEDYMTREKGGTGLGLAIVKKIVELHKGTIGVESELEKGTVFRVFIPN
ncbi:HAMP domain-containing histidine kinase [Candidatus Woesearchaeota archaeon]|jgi:signal transduction histidine kinase|nr:HAMP domain-containing histidine kinase [Candidatus Woesearchaeota archaeon]